MATVTVQHPPRYTLELSEKEARELLRTLADNPGNYSVYDELLNAVERED